MVTFHALTFKIVAETRYDLFELKKILLKQVLSCFHKHPLKISFQEKFSYKQFLQNTFRNFLKCNPFPVTITLLKTVGNPFLLTKIPQVAVKTDNPYSLQ